MNSFESRMPADHSGLLRARVRRPCRGFPPLGRTGIHHVRTFLFFALLIVACTVGCERRIVRKEERVFMHYAEKNWRRLTPRQKADYYEMIERQKDRARREAAKERQRKSR